MQDEEAEEFDADEAERLANERQMAGDGKGTWEASLEGFDPDDRLMSALRLLSCVCLKVHCVCPFCFS